MLMTLNYTQYVSDVQDEADPKKRPEQTSAVMMYAHRQPVGADQGFQPRRQRLLQHDFG